LTIVIIFPKSTKCEAPHYYIFSGILLFSVSFVQIFSSAPPS
jgi:hypothetical protein